MSSLFGTLIEKTKCLLFAGDFPKSLGFEQKLILGSPCCIVRVPKIVLFVRIVVCVSNDVLSNKFVNRIYIAFVHLVSIYFFF